MLKSPNEAARCQMKADTEFPWRKPRRLQSHPNTFTFLRPPRTPAPNLMFARGSPGEGPNPTLLPQRPSVITRHGPDNPKEQRMLVPSAPPPRPHAKHFCVRQSTSHLRHLPGFAEGRSAPEPALPAGGSDPRTAADSSGWINAPAPLLRACGTLRGVLRGLPGFPAGLSPHRPHGPASLPQLTSPLPYRHFPGSLRKKRLDLKSSNQGISPEKSQAAGVSMLSSCQVL